MDSSSFSFPRCHKQIHFKHSFDNHQQFYRQTNEWGEFIIKVIESRAINRIFKETTEKGGEEDRRQNESQQTCICFQNFTIFCYFRSSSKAQHFICLCTSADCLIHTDRHTHTETQHNTHTQTSPDLTNAEPEDENSCHTHTHTHIHTHTNNTVKHTHTHTHTHN